jgi:hypothetical protein
MSHEAVSLSWGATEVERPTGALFNDKTMYFNVLHMLERGGHGVVCTFSIYEKGLMGMIHPWTSNTRAGFVVGL